VIPTTIDISNTLLIGLNLTYSKSEWSCEDSLLELAQLARTAGLTVCTKCTQTRERPHPKCYVGTGKVEEIKALCEKESIKIVIADDELTPTQHKNLEKELKLKILDRTSLILNIFAQHAKTRESQLQVELAQLEYQLPRLTRLWTHLSRLGGGIGTKGPGEKQLEVDKRQTRNRIIIIKEKLEKIKQQRDIRREKRQKLPIITGAIVGYTNAGKSTLMNLLTKADVLVEDQLFATLDATTRKLRLFSKNEILITDTVGFIQKLPHQLVSSFRSTLEEALDSNFLIHLIDISHPNFLGMLNTANNLLKELHPDEIPQIYVFNKIDAVSDIKHVLNSIEQFQPQIHISAKKNTNITQLLKAIETMIVKQCKIFNYQIPYSRMDIVNLIHKNANRIITENYENNISIKAELNTIIGEKIMGHLYKESRNTNIL
jgi:GTPase